MSSDHLKREAPTRGQVPHGTRMVFWAARPARVGGDASHPPKTSGAVLPGVMDGSSRVENSQARCDGEKRPSITSRLGEAGAGLRRGAPDTGGSFEGVPHSSKRRGKKR